MDAHYHEVGGVLEYVPGVHSSRCPVCVPPVVETVDVPVVPIRRPHRKSVVTPPEAA